MQKGDIRTAVLSNGNWTTRLVKDQDFMLASFQPVLPMPETFGQVVLTEATPVVETKAPLAVRVPGTNVYVKRLK